MPFLTPIILFFEILIVVDSSILDIGSKHKHLYQLMMLWNLVCDWQQ